MTETPQEPRSDEQRSALEVIKQNVRKLKIPRSPLLVGLSVFSITTLLFLSFTTDLMASLRSSLIQTVAGTSEDGETGLAVESLPPSSGSGDAPISAQQPAGPKLASISELNLVSNRHQLTATRDVPPGYLPKSEQDTLDEAPDADVLVTVPVSQGRLLRFDETVESVFIGDQSIADIRVVSPQLLYVYGKRLGHTNLMAISAKTGGNGPRIAGSALLRVVTDDTPLQEATNEAAPDAPVDIKLFGSRTAVRGKVASIDEAVAVSEVAETYSPRDQPPINSATLEGSNQVNLRVRFAEVSRNDLKSFGIDWSVAVNAGSFSFGLQKLTTANGPLEPNLETGVGAGNFNIDLLIEALQANGALTVLAEPNLTAVTGETASFLAGGEVPIPVPTGRDGESITVSFKPFGVSLAFTPTLVKGSRIGLRVKPEVSSISAATNFSVQGFNIPAFSVRRAETTVEVASGQTFALAGLFQREVSRNVEKLPFLGDLPILGKLFRSQRYQKNETELVILITPYLVQPVSDRSLATPLDQTGSGSPWQADVVGPDPTDKGAEFKEAEARSTSGFIMK